MRIDVDDIIKLINQEIEWTDNNRDSTIPVD